MKNAQKPKVVGIPFAPGNPGGPGRPPVPEDIRMARKINQVEFDRIINKYLYMDLSAAEAAMKSKDIPLIELMIASIIQRAIKDGDEMRLKFLIERTVGPAPKDKPPEGDDGLVKNVAGMSPEEIESNFQRLLSAAQS